MLGNVTINRDNIHRQSIGKLCFMVLSPLHYACSALGLGSKMWLLILRIDITSSIIVERYIVAKAFSASYQLVDSNYAVLSVYYIYNFAQTRNTWSYFCFRPCRLYIFHKKNLLIKFK